jgi:hypothetical protein
MSDGGAAAALLLPVAGELERWRKDVTARVVGGRRRRR